MQAKYLSAIRCVICRKEYTGEELETQPPEKQGKCPNCEATGLPEYTIHDVQVTLNWHELRILCIWAKNWQENMPLDRKEEAGRCLESIFNLIRLHRPENTPGLTLQDEMKELAITHGPVELSNGNEVQVFEKPKVH